MADLDCALIMARQAAASPSGRKLLGKAVCSFVRNGPENHAFVREIGTILCRMGGPRLLRTIAETAAASDDEFGCLARDELLSGFWKT
ncbi:MAG: hypothetical protein ACOY3L_10065 [Pseudomonadota bacterium]